jgi:hypothetical protein
MLTLPSNPEKASGRDCSAALICKCLIRMQSYSVGLESCFLQMHQPPLSRMAMKGAESFLGPTMWLSPHISFRNDTDKKKEGLR